MRLYDYPVSYVPRMPADEQALPNFPRSYIPMTPDEALSLGEPPVIPFVTPLEIWSTILGLAGMGASAWMKKKDGFVYEVTLYLSSSVFISGIMMNLWRHTTVSHEYALKQQ